MKKTKFYVAPKIKVYDFISKNNLMQNMGDDSADPLGKEFFDDDDDDDDVISSGGSVWDD